MRVKGTGAFLAALLTAVGYAQIIDTPTGEKGAAPAQSVQTQAAPKQDVQLKTETTKVPFKTRYEVSRTVGQGRIVKKQAGVDGSVVKTYEIVLVNGKPTRKLVETKTNPATDEIYAIGSTGYATSRGSYNRHKVLTMQATAYDPSAGLGSRATFRTKNGMRAGYGKVAVDPRVIPLGTMLYVEGYGICIAADTGGAIKGNRIDLCFPTKSECIRFGRRNVRVHILK